LFTNKTYCLQFESLTKTFAVLPKQGKEQHINVNSYTYLEPKIKMLN
jgi:hypothetical protein